MNSKANFNLNCLIFVLLIINNPSTNCKHELDNSKQSSEGIDNHYFKMKWSKLNITILEVSYHTVLLFLEKVAVPELLNSVFDQIDSLLAAFKNNNRDKRDAEKNDGTEMDCNTFLKVLDMYEQLQNLTKSPQMIASNHQEIEKLSNDIQMYSTYDGISQESCQTLDTSILESINQKVESTESSLGKS